MDPLTVFVGIGGVLILLGLGGGMVFMLGALFRPAPDYRAKNQPPSPSPCTPSRPCGLTGAYWDVPITGRCSEPQSAITAAAQPLRVEVITPQKQTRPAPRRSEPAALPRGQEPRGLPGGAPARSLPAGGKQKALPEGDRYIPVPNWPVRNPEERRRKQEERR